MEGKTRQNICHCDCTEDMKKAENIQSQWEKETDDYKLNIISQSKKELQFQTMLESGKKFTGRCHKMGMLWGEEEARPSDQLQLCLRSVLLLSEDSKRTQSFKICIRSQKRQTLK